MIKGKKLLGMALCLLLMLLAAGLTVAAAEEWHTDHVELFSEGAFPKETSTGLSIAQRSDFNTYMLGKLNAYATEIDVSSYRMTLEQFRAAYRGLLNSRPEMFFVSGGYSYYSSGSYVTGIIPTYNYTAAELPALQAIYRQGVSDIVNYARSASTDVGRLMRANDYMCAYYEYDTSYTIYSPELFFQNKTGVCQAYMLAYRAVLNELGITNITVSSDEMNHTWNMVKLDGSWYHIDVTWNDPIDDVPLRAYHDNFLLSDAGIAAAGHESWDDSWETIYTANNTKYDEYFWIDLMQVAPMLGDTVYYVDPNHTGIQRDVYAHNLATGAVSKVCSYDYGYRSYYQGRNPIWVIGDAIYFGSENYLMKQSISGGTAEEIYDAGSGNWICYPIQSGTELKVHVSQSPWVTGQTITCPLNINYSLSMDTSFVCLELEGVGSGDQVQLNAVLTPAPSGAYTLEWSSSDTAVATVDANGQVTGRSTGIAEIVVSYGKAATASCTVAVIGEDVLLLPCDTAEIQEEAFAGTAPKVVELSENVTTIGARAFADNEKLLLVFVSETVTSIADDAFSGCPNVTLLCLKDTEGEAHAIGQHIPYVIME